MTITNITVKPKDDFEPRDGLEKTMYQDRTLSASYRKPLSVEDADELIDDTLGQIDYLRKEVDYLRTRGEKYSGKHYQMVLERNNLRQYQDDRAEILNGSN